MIQFRLETILGDMSRPNGEAEQNIRGKRPQRCINDVPGFLLYRKAESTPASVTVYRRISL
jgi:hypothetical protein